MKLNEKLIGRYGDSDLLCDFLAAKYSTRLPKKLADAFYNHEEAYILLKPKGECESFVCISRDPNSYSSSFSKSFNAEFGIAVVLIRWNRAKAFIVKDCYL